MSWAVEYDPVTKIIEVIFVGRVTSEELKAAATERIRLQEQHDTLFVLINASRIEQLVAGIFGAHSLPARLYNSAKMDKGTYGSLIREFYPRILNSLWCGHRRAG